MTDLLEVRFNGVPFYAKSEADTLIAQQRGEIERLTDQLATLDELRDDPHIQRFGGDTLAEKIANALCSVHTVRRCKTCPNGYKSRELREGRCVDCWMDEAKKSNTPTPEASDE